MPTPEDIILALPCWRGRPSVAPLTGGLSNANFKVADAEGVYVARVGRDVPVHHVSRSREAAASSAAEAAGLAPKVRYAGGGVLVCDFIEGRALAPEDIRAKVEAMTQLVARGHREMRARVRGEAAMFWVFHVIRDYAETLGAAGRPIAPDVISLAASLEDAQVPLPIVFGHHDLLAANFIDDGRRLWLIDWEYAGFGTPMFDLANLADNAEFDEALETRLLELYFGRAPDAALARAFAAARLASALREWLWALVSEIHLAAPGVDYVAYASACRDKFERARLRYPGLGMT
jgi:thiamine kinase-like enzyme